MGSTGYGNGPVMTAGVMTLGAVLGAGWGMARIVSNPDKVVIALSSEEPRQGAPSSGDGTLEMPAAREKQPSQAPPAMAPPETDPGSKHGAKDGPGGGPGVSEGTGPEPVGDTTYRIRPGDTLSEISSEKGVPVEMLAEYNHIENPNLIYAGASLLIPTR
ncbi:MAG: LysM peptidoglycan-binding domain-containing protein [Pseudonocardiaceae bacterium]